MCKVSKTSIIATACLLAFSSSSTLAQTIWDSNQLPQSIIKEPKKEKLYTVYFNPFLVRTESEKFVAQKYEKDKFNPEEWEEIFSKEMDKYNKSPGRQAVASRILAHIGRSLMDKDIHFHSTASAITLPLNKTDYNKLNNLNELVTLINEFERIPYELSFPYFDHQDSGELVSWAKHATNTNDNKTTSNFFYFIDYYPANLQSTTEYHINLIHQGGSNIDDFKYHPAAIASIVSGKRNNFLARGINPGQPLYMGVGSLIYNPGLTFEELINHADYRKISSVLNLSLNVREGNGIDYYINPHNEGGKMMLRASNRFLISQSASNIYPGDVQSSACPFVYNIDGSIVNNDAILSIGAINYEGKIMSSGINDISGGQSVSSRVGPCVDFYAPGSEVYAYASGGEIRYGSGTSYAAPIVAAIASRYGDNKTKPLVREDYINSILVPTGHFDPLDGKAVKIPRYKPYSFGILTHHPIVYAVSSVNAQKIKYIKDDNFFQRPDEFWDASGNTGSFTVDLGEVKNIKGIRIVLETSSPGINPVYFNIYGSVAPMSGNSYTYDLHKPTSLIKSHIAPFQYERAPIYIPLSGNYRSIRIDGNNPTSWFAVVEVEVYGH